MSRPVTCVLSRESRPCRYRQRRLGLIGVPPCASMRILAAYRGREQVPAERDGGGFRLSEWFLVPQSPESVHSMHRGWLEGILTSRGPSGPGLWALGSGLWTLGKSWWTTLRSRSAFWWGSCSCCRSWRRTALAAGCGALVSSCSKLGPLVDEPRSSLHSPTAVINPAGGPCSSSILMIQLSSMPRQQAPEWRGRRLFEMHATPHHSRPVGDHARPLLESQDSSPLLCRRRHPGSPHRRRT